jgi:hypothetical protein
VYGRRYCALSSQSGGCPLQVSPTSSITEIGPVY